MLLFEASVYKDTPLQGEYVWTLLCTDSQVRFSDTTGWSCLRNPPIKAAVCVLSDANLHAEVTSSAETLLNCYES